ncbi:hypothetical protein SBC2_77580 (plasmid) [Caballeronia sp. SBC2]|nr:hypothetical protein SBC2_77580 [Caballeronia sp. SBC2]
MAQRLRYACQKVTKRVSIKQGQYKAVLIHRRTWKIRESVELATMEWVAWFDHHRLMEALGYILPIEA